jgi:hypothetical protein
MGAAPRSILGFLKYSKMADFCESFAAATSHITRKKAMSAVTKSA